MTGYIRMTLLLFALVATVIGLYAVWAETLPANTMKILLTFALLAGAGAVVTMFSLPRKPDQK